jgi:hypothetical protein
MRVRIEFDSRRGRIAFRCGITAAVVLLACIPLAYASQVGVLNTFSPGEVIRSSDMNSNFTALKVAINDTDTKCGDLTTLTTTAKGNLVASVNEVNGKIPSGTILTSVTTDGTTLTGNGTAATPLSVSFASGETTYDARYLQLTGGTVSGPTTFDALAGSAGGDSILTQGGAATGTGPGGRALIALGGDASATTTGNGGDAIEATGGNPGTTSGTRGLAAKFHGNVTLGGDTTAAVAPAGALTILGATPAPATSQIVGEAAISAQGGDGSNEATSAIGNGGVGGTGASFTGGAGGAGNLATGGAGGIGVSASGGPGGPDGSGGSGGTGLMATGGDGLNAAGTGIFVVGGKTTAGGGAGGIGIEAKGGPGTTGPLGLAARFDGNVQIVASGGATGTFSCAGDVNLGSSATAITLGAAGTQVTVPGTLNLTGTLNVGAGVTKPGGSFKIDHPLDPENKFLYHSFVESPDMKNVYDGVVVLDEKGEATVALPSYFEALNRDFRYQLTCVGGFAPVYVSKEVHANCFSIAGGKPGLKVSWQITGIRQDAWANAHRIEAEVEKSPTEKGKLLYPLEQGRPESCGIGSTKATR